MTRGRGSEVGSGTRGVLVEGWRWGRGTGSEGRGSGSESGAGSGGRGVMGPRRRVPVWMAPFLGDPGVDTSPGIETS